jgi:hypothetical protein
MDKTETSSDDGVREFSHFRSRSSHFVIEFQFINFDTTNNNELSSFNWLARQLWLKSDKIHRFRQQIRAHQMILQRAIQKVASLVEAVQSASEINLTPSLTNPIFPRSSF